MTVDPHLLSQPSSWVQRWSHLVAPQARVLDVACGSGRHVHWFTQRGCQVTGVDRDAQALAGLPPEATRVQADIETGPWPLAGEQFDTVVVTNYLWRPLWPTLVASLAPNGVMLYETFAVGNELLGKPSNPDFLLRPGELLNAMPSLHVVAFEQGFLDQPPRAVQRLIAVRLGDAKPGATRHPLPA